MTRRNDMLTNAMHADVIAAENARLRARVAALEAALQAIDFDGYERLLVGTNDRIAHSVAAAIAANAAQVRALVAQESER